METIIIKAKLPMDIKKDGDWFVSCCPVLDIATQGKSKKEAKANLKEAVEMFLHACIEMGTFEEVLKDCGFSLDQPEEQPVATPKSRNNVSVDIPFYLLGNNGNSAFCPA